MGKELSHATRPSLHEARATSFNAEARSPRGAEPTTTGSMEGEAPHDPRVDFWPFSEPRSSGPPFSKHTTIPDHPWY